MAKGREKGSVMLTAFSDLCSAPHSNSLGSEMMVASAVDSSVRRRYRRGTRGTQCQHLSTVCMHAGKHMTYSERWGTGWLASLGTTAMVALVTMLPRMAARYQFVRDALPAPGDGPSREIMENGKWSLELWALSHEEAGDSAAPRRVHAKMAVRCSLNHKNELVFACLCFWGFPPSPSLVTKLKHL